MNLQNNFHLFTILYDKISITSNKNHLIYTYVILIYYILLYCILCSNNTNNNSNNKSWITSCKMMKIKSSFCVIHKKKKLHYMSSTRQKAEKYYKEWLHITEFSKPWLCYGQLLKKRIAVFFRKYVKLKYWILYYHGNIFLNTSKNYNCINYSISRYMPFVHMSVQTHFRLALNDIIVMLSMFGKLSE